MMHNEYKRKQKKVDLEQYPWTESRKDMQYRYVVTFAFSTIGLGLASLIFLAFSDAG